MSKAYGKKIAIKFTEKLIGDVSGLTPEPVNGYEDVIEKNGIKTAYNSYSSSYLPDKAFDNNEFTKWYTRVPVGNWIQLELEFPLTFYKFRWKSYSSYSPKDFQVLGSNDQVTWETLYTGVGLKTSDWSDYFIFESTGQYKYYRWNILSSYGSYLYIYEIEPVYSRPIGNEAAFVISGQEPLYINYPDETLGPLVSKTYAVKSVENHPLEVNTILLTMKDVEEFKNTEGNLTISYNAVNGNLAGLGGTVSSFEYEFLPTDLIRKPNPKINEKITASIKDYDLVLVPVFYKDIYSSTEIISVSITDYQITLTDTGEIDP